MLTPIPEDATEFADYERSQMPLTEAEQAAATAAQTAAVTAAVEAERVRVEAEKLAAIQAERNRSAETRAQLEAATTEAQALKDAETARVAAALEKDKEFEKLAAHNLALAEQAKKDLAAANASADAKVAAIQGERVAERRQTALAEIAKAAGLIHMDDLAKIDASKISWGEDGKPVGADAAIASLKTERPHYFKVEGSGATYTGPGAMGLPTPAQPGTGGGGTVDVRTLSEKEFNDQYAQLGKHATA